MTTAQDHAALLARMGTPLLGKPQVMIGRGRKSGNGSYGVVAKDRFFIAQPAEGRGLNAYRPLAKGYESYNLDPRIGADGFKRRGPAPDKDAVEAHAATRRLLHGTLIASRWLDLRDGDGGCVLHELKAYKPPDGVRCGQVPDSRPWCHSYDALTATRWDGREFAQIPCPGHKCEYRDGDSPPCSKRLHLVLDLRWPEQPCHACNGTGLRDRDVCPACKGERVFSWSLPPARAHMDAGGSFSYASSGVEAFYADFCQQWEAVAKLAQVEDTEPDMYGLPVSIRLVAQTSQRGGGRKFYIPHIYPDFPPGTTLQGWMLDRVRAAETARPLLEGAYRQPLLTAADDVEDAEYEVEQVTRG